MASTADKNSVECHTSPKKVVEKSVAHEVAAEENGKQGECVTNGKSPVKKSPVKSQDVKTNGEKLDSSVLVEQTAAAENGEADEQLVESIQEEEQAEAAAAAEADEQDVEEDEVEQQDGAGEAGVEEEKPKNGSAKSSPMKKKVAGDAPAPDEPETKKARRSLETKADCENGASAEKTEEASNGAAVVEAAE